MKKEENIMTPEEFEQKMIEIAAIPCTKERHERGDSLMQEVLTQLGYGAGANFLRN